MMLQPTSHPEVLDRLTPAKRPDERPIGYQRWRSLLFLHWQVSEEELRPLIPASLSLDLYDNAAYVGLVLFSMEGVRARWWPELLSSQFLETNVRTYVHYQGKPGIYFMSMDANHRPAVWAARRGWSLPYHHAKMEMNKDDQRIDYQLIRSGAGTSHQTRYQVGPALGPSEPNTLENFLLERYFLFVEHRNRLCCAQVHHVPYPAHSVEVTQCQDDLLSSAGLENVSGHPQLAHFVPGVDVEIFSLRPESK